MTSTLAKNNDDIAVKYLGIDIARAFDRVDVIDHSAGLGVSTPNDMAQRYFSPEVVGAIHDVDITPDVLNVSFTVEELRLWGVVVEEGRVALTLGGRWLFFVALVAGAALLGPGPMAVLLQTLQCSH